MSGLLSPDIQETVTGTAQILEILRFQVQAKLQVQK